VTKVALLADSHWGVRNDNMAMIEMNKKFLDHVFFPELDKRKIERIYHLGDLVDKRKSINILTLKRMQEDFLDRVEARGYYMTIIAGNHDTYHKTTNYVNAIKTLTMPYMKIDYVIDQPETATTFGQKILCVPWICDENRERSMQAIAQSNARWCFGHLELAGYQMYRGVINEHGDDKELFSKFEGVYTGHFHHKSSVGNVHYLGSHGQFTWSDYGDQRGFHVLDVETGELEFIPNPFQMFLKIGYDDTQTNPIWNLDGSEDLDIANKYVKVVVRAKEKPVKFEKLMAALQEQKPLDIQVIDEAFNLDASESLDLVVDTEDTMSIFKQHIDSLEDPDVSKDDLEACIFGLYKKAKELVI
jgi:hypothetical protein